MDHCVISILLRKAADAGVEPRTIEQARVFLLSLPVGMPPPVSIDSHDGQIAYRWDTGNARARYVTITSTTNVHVELSSPDSGEEISGTVHFKVARGILERLIYI